MNDNIRNAVRLAAAGLCWLVLAGRASAAAQPPETAPGATPATAPSRSAVMAAATVAAAAHLQVPPAAVVLREPDARLNPPACAAGFQGKPAPGTSGTGRVTVEVSCPGSPWRTFISARLGSVVGAGGTPLPMAGNDNGGAAGAGRQPVRPSRLALAVRRGSPVTLSVGTAMFHVATDGIALADAPLGALVRVRNVATGREVEGRVVGDGQVALATAAPSIQGNPQVAAEAVDNTSVGPVARRGDYT